MSYLLHIETTSTVCSVALSNDAELIALKEINNGYTHVENLHIFIEDILKEASIKPKQLQAISVSSGPGSYTGLRIGFSAAKGLAFALQIPLITVHSLRALTTLALQKNESDVLYCPMVDARRMEVYCSVFNHQLHEIIPVNALVLSEESIHVFKKDKPIYFFGDGMPKAKEMLKTIPNSYFIENITPSAKMLISLAYKKYAHKEFADIAYSEPLYLKEFFFATPKK